MKDDNSDTEAGDIGENEPFDRKYPGRLLEQGRERGLSKADREYLASGGETITSESENAHINIRHRIRSRVRESIVDFWLLTEFLSDRDRELIFRESKDDWDNRELQIGLKSAIQFFYTALENSDLVDFDTVLGSAIHDAEREKHDSPVLVDVDFDVEVDDQFHVQEAYDKFQRGVPLNPMEVGVLLVTGWVHEPEMVEKLAQHARSNGLIEHSVAPLLAQQLADISGEDEPIDTFQYTLAHLPEEESHNSPIESTSRYSDYFYLEEERHFQEEGFENASIEDLLDEDLAEELDDQSPRDDAEILDEDADDGDTEAADEDPVDADR